jgi:hypothetical protein
MHFKFPISLVNIIGSSANRMPVEDSLRRLEIQNAPLLYLNIENQIINFPLTDYYINLRPI